MARKHKHPEHENLERWLVSYADFMTLLFATFTALYALAQTDAAKLKDVGAAIREGFEEQSLINGIKSILEGKNPPSRNPDPLSSDKGAGQGIMGKFDSMTYQPGEVKSMKHLVDSLKSDLKNANEAVAKAIQNATQASPPKPSPPGVATGQGQASNVASGQGSAPKVGQGDGPSPGQGQGPQTQKTAPEDPRVPVKEIGLSVQERGVRISFDSRLLFTAGSATLRPESYKFLDVVARRLATYQDQRIHVEGHTDDQPIATAMFPSNWELSAARASSVVRYFQDHDHFNPAYLVAVGYGSTQPISSNATAEGRTRNRRVDIVLYNDKTSNLLSPRYQMINEAEVNTDPPVSTESHTPGQDKTVLPLLPAANPDAPVRVIIKDKDGSEKVLIPKLNKLVPIDQAPIVESMSAPALGKAPRAAVKTEPAHSKK